MESLKYLKEFLEINQTDIFTEITSTENIKLNPPHLIIKPVRSIKDGNIKIINFRVAFVDLKNSYSDIISFTSKLEKILDNLESHKIMQRNSDPIKREIKWESFEKNNNSYYKGTVEYEVNEIRLTTEDSDEYLTMNEIKLGGM